MKLLHLSAAARMSRLSTLFASGVIAITLHVSTTQSSAALIASESFEYSTGLASASLDGQAGGFGWTGSWNVLGNERYSVVAGSLDYPPGFYDSVGNSLNRTVSTPGGSGGTRTYDVSSLVGDSIWFSFLVNLRDEGDVSSTAFFPVAADVFSPTGSTNISLGLGAFVSDAGTVVARIGDLALGSTLGISFNQDTLIVGRVDLPALFTGSATVLVWVNPGLGDLLSGTNSSSITVGNLNSALGPNVTSYGQLDRLAFRYGVTSFAELDEFLLGTDFLSVTGIPEPSRAVLLGLAGLLLIVRRRR